MTICVYRGKLVLQLNNGRRIQQFILCLGKLKVKYRIANSMSGKE